ncbi:predicted protein [Nematostella vectensis]|uniref:RING-type domain-containing protein n=1 Tax=Nematostella vectensis TaxID=45351 RepID=A7SDU3_NEMVE|nr:predicted protein [Nematostella vectensis]|eukprot:XP_001630199.1 predicted protein [Nematostella vectensis]
MAAKLELFDVCPLLVPQDGTGRHYIGYISVDKHSYRIAIHVPEDNNLQNARIECSWKLRHLLRGCDNVIRQRLSQSVDLCSFLIELKTLLEKLLKSKPEGENLVVAHPLYYTNLIKELEQISWDKLVYVDPSFKVLKLMARDSKLREHQITIQLSSQHPTSAPSCVTELPGKFSFNWQPNEAPLQALFQQFKQVLNSYEDFWDMMDEVDRKTWVLEPDRPTRACTTRRIALGNNASVQVEVNPSYPRLLPEDTSLESQHVVGECLCQKLRLSEPSVSVLTNLENVMGVKFPSPSSSKKEDFSMECGICYAYRLNDTIPDKACDDPRCGQPFHRDCLYEWLRSLPSSRQSFNMVFGECPYCSKPITVKMTS